MARSNAKPSPTLTYPFVDGYLHHWLTVGPHDQPLTAAPLPGEELTAFQARILEQSSVSSQDFVNVTELDRVRWGEDEQFWEVAHCQDDHWLSWHDFLPHYTYRRAWGYLQLKSARAQEVTIHCTTTCPLRIWLNGEPILQTPIRLTLAQPPSQGVTSFRLTGEIPSPPEADRESSSQIMHWHPMGSHLSAPLRERNDVVQQFSVKVRFVAGVNPLLVRLEQIGVREMAMMAAVRVEQRGAPRTPITIQLPTVSRAPRRRQHLEEIYAKTHLDRAVYGKSDPIRLYSPPAGSKVPVQLRLQKASGAIYAETIGALYPGAVIESVRGSQLPNGALEAVVMAPLQQFYNEKLRARHIFSILVANQPFYGQPPDQSSDERLIEALRASVQHAEGQHAGSTYSELAKMAFGWWEQVDGKVIHRAVERVMSHEAGFLPDLLGLITMRSRMPAYRGFPQMLLPDLDRGLTTFALNGDASAAWDGEEEANQLQLMAARHLIGQLYPNLSVNRGDSANLIGWMAERGRIGFRHWQSDHDLLVTALASLVSLAQDEGVREMAAVLLDLLAFGLAIHSFGGTFGASRAKVTPAGLRSGRFAPEAALNRLLWGTGGYQSACAATVALGLAGKSYALPDLIHAIALAQPAESWVRERHGDANLVSYKTPEYLLSSLQRVRAGGPSGDGGRAQLWQATLGPEAMVFCNNPASFSQDAAAVPGWWVGNSVLPAIAQHQNSLITLYALPATAWMNFTHAYFPTYAFDEHRIGEGWAFARVGDGYLALWAAPRFTLVDNGPDAGRELRVDGSEAVWLCQMGRHQQDGDFAEFQHKVLASAPQRHDEGVIWTTVRGDTLAFGLNGPFMVNGQAVALDHFPRHSSPFGQAGFPADQLDIVVGEEGLRLHFVA